MKKLFRVWYLSVLLVLTFVQSGFAQSGNADAIIRTLNNPKDKNVVVAAHRGDWRNYPENSLPAIESAINMGAGIVEIDLAMTSDSVLVLMHDRSVNRTTNGQGAVITYTLDSLQKLKLKDHNGMLTEYTIPTFEEVMLLCKEKAIVNVDKGFQYYGKVYDILKKTGTTRQALIKSGHPAEKIKGILSQYPGEQMMYMPIIDFRFDRAEEILDGYLKNMPAIAYEVVFKEYTPEMKEVFKKILKSGARVWVNTMWNSLCGMNDDMALEDPDAVYGKFLKEGATIFQTDRPELMVEYLRGKELHR